MANLATTYMGLPLRSPLIASSCPITIELDNLIKLDEMGVGAAVLPSLFEEQINYEERFEPHKKHFYDVPVPDELRHVMEMDGYNKGSAGYLSLIYQAKQRVNMPIIASLNGVHTERWVLYAKLLEGAGADAIELNTYFLTTNSYLTSSDVEDQYVDLVKAVRAETTVPLAIKITPYISALPAFVLRLQEAGADAVVLFNRFYQPDIDPVTETITSNLELSTTAELRLRLRWAGILSGTTDADLALTGGVQSGQDLAKVILAGGTIGMVASALLRSGVDYAADILAEFALWMDNHGYDTIDQFSGKLSPKTAKKMTHYTRANYIKELRSYADAEA